MNWEKEVEKEIAQNEELRKVFEQHPERKAMYIEKMKDAALESPRCATLNPKYCKTCAFAHGAPPFADMPEKAYCEMYPRGESTGKPNAVLFEGAECPFYEKEK